MKDWGCGAYLVCLNDDPRLTLIYVMAGSNLLPNAIKWGKIKEKNIFLKLLEPN